MMAESKIYVVPRELWKGLYGVFMADQLSWTSITQDQIKQRINIKRTMTKRMLKLVLALREWCKIMMGASISILVPRHLKGWKQTGYKLKLVTADFPSIVYTCQIKRYLERTWALPDIEKIE